MSDELKQIIDILNSISEEDRKEALNVLNQVRIELEDKLQDQVYYDFNKKNKMCTKEYKKGDKIRQYCGEMWEYIGISRSRGFKAYIYAPISEAVGYGRCDEEWCKSDKLPKGSIPFSEKLKGEKICK